MSPQKYSLLFAGFMTAFLAAPVYAQAAEEDQSQETEIEFSESEELLWLQPHLEDIDKPTKLVYNFSKSGAYEEGFSDTVTLDVVKIHDDGTKSTELTFFTGHRQQKNFSEENLKNVEGNPVLGIYMQGDVYEMNRLTEGSWRYFQRQIKFALADDAKVEDISVEYNGKKVPAKKVSFAPYVNDDLRANFDRFADKTYELILSEEIPGYLYKIVTVIPDNVNVDAEPLIVEELVLAEVQPL
ncbi:MAG: hypothetical protein WD572_00360 [Gammaproteobacteria bacterium]